ncbi:MAG: hypothetical protein CL609_07530 [Anaerolineaceae bacterium]|nr:hypothetical protein [Anaerolineaceae bacterium]
MQEPTGLVDPQTLLPRDDAVAILGLRLLIARAANVDSLHWWEDNAFSEPAQFIFNRTFPGVPTLAARNLALRAAVARHLDACPPDALHLYHLDFDNLDRLVLEFWQLTEIVVPVEPIKTMEALRQHLLHLTAGPMPYEVVRTGANGGLQIRLPEPPKDVNPLHHRAVAFAWAFLEGQPGQPVIPYSLE